MLFRRRKPPSLWERMRTYLWPRRSFSRSIRYIAKRVLRLTATPHAIAAGVAAGIFASWTPFIGFHFMMAFVIAYLVAGNMVAAAIGTSFGNPVTFPFIWTSCYELGKFILGQETGGDRHINLVRLFRHLEIADLWQPVLEADAGRRDPARPSLRGDLLRRHLLGGERLPHPPPPAHGRPRPGAQPGRDIPRTTRPCERLLRDVGSAALTSAAARPNKAT